MRKLRTIEMQRLSVDEFHEAAKLPLIVVLDDVRSLHNVGSVFRSGDAFRVEAVYLCGITATPPHPEIHKTALGGEDSVAWRYFPTATEAQRRLLRVQHRAGGGVDKASEPATRHRQTLRNSAGQRGEGSASGGGGHVGRMSRNTTIRHQTLAQCQRNGWYGNMGSG